MTIIGTNCFVTKTHAKAYYADYGCSSLDVEYKIITKEIRIGRPLNAPIDTRVYLDQSEGRYIIETKD